MAAVHCCRKPRMGQTAEGSGGGGGVQGCGWGWLCHSPQLAALWQSAAAVDTQGNAECSLLTLLAGPKGLPRHEREQGSPSRSYMQLQGALCDSCLPCMSLDRGMRKDPPQRDLGAGALLAPPADTALTNRAEKTPAFAISPPRC